VKEKYKTLTIYLVMKNSIAQGYLKKISCIELCMVDKGFGAKQYQKTTLASNPKRDYYNLAQKGGGGRAPSGFTYDYGYQILLPIRNPYINRFTNHFSIHS
jgi:hypothetical protein